MFAVLSTAVQCTILTKLSPSLLFNKVYCFTVHNIPTAKRKLVLVQCKPVYIV